MVLCSVTPSKLNTVLEDGLCWERGREQRRDCGSILQGGTWVVRIERVVQVSVVEVRFEQRLKGGEGIGRAGIWGRVFLG